MKFPLPNRCCCHCLSPVLASRQVKWVMGPAPPTLSKPYRKPSRTIDVCHSLRNTLLGPNELHTSETSKLLSLRGFNDSSVEPWFSPEERNTPPSSATGAAILQLKS